MPLYRKRPKKPFLSQNSPAVKHVSSAFKQPCSQNSVENILQFPMSSPNYPETFSRTASEPNESAFGDFKSFDQRSTTNKTSLGDEVTGSLNISVANGDSNYATDYLDLEKEGVPKEIANVDKSDMEIEKILLNDKSQLIQEGSVSEKIRENKSKGKENKLPIKKRQSASKSLKSKEKKNKLKLSKEENSTQDIFSQFSEPKNEFQHPNYLDTSLNSSRSSQLSLNEPSVREAYKNFLLKKEETKKIIPSSQSSDISLNEPVVKEAYSQFIKKKSKFTRVDTPKLLTHYDQMKWLQKQRSVGVYVFCDKCDKLRYLEDIQDPTLLPDKWYCKDNTDTEHNRCEIPEEKFPLFVQEDWIENLYNAGSIVWARVEGYPWWPGMVDDDPNTESYYWLDDDINITPSYYHVTFFDKGSVTRAWLKPKDIKSFYKEKNNPDLLPSKYSVFKTRIDFAFEQAKEALDMSIQERLEKFSFLTRYKKPINMPKDVTRSKKKSSKVKKTEDKIKRKDKFGSREFLTDDFELPSNSALENLTLDLFDEF